MTPILRFNVSADGVHVDGPHGLVGRGRARPHLLPYALGLLEVSVEVREVVCPDLTFLSSSKLILNSNLIINLM